MKATGSYTFLLAAVALWVLFGCSREYELQILKPKVAMALTGAIHDRTKSGSIDPQPSGLPPKQMAIGVAMIDHDTATPDSDPPAEVAWNGAVEWKRAYFGGPGLKTGSALATFVPTNGEISFTNDDGTAVNKVFYNDNGFYRFLRAFHPWEGAAVVPAVGGGVVLMPIDGSQDIICSNMVYGSAESKMSYTPPYVDKPLIFSHLLTKLNIRLVAEDAAAIVQYGKIMAIEVLDQPNMVSVNISSGLLEAASSLAYPYGVVDFLANATLPAPAILNPEPFDDAVQFGYVMVVPAKTYTIRIETELRLTFYVDVVFAAPADAGKAYNITLQFMVADEILIFAQEAPQWWLNSTFN